MRLSEKENIYNEIKQNMDHVAQNENFFLTLMEEYPDHPFIDEFNSILELFYRTVEKLQDK